MDFLSNAFLTIVAGAWILVILMTYIFGFFFFCVIVNNLLNALLGIQPDTSITYYLPSDSDTSGFAGLRKTEEQIKARLTEPTKARR